MEIRPFKDRCYAVFGATGWVGSVLCHNLRMGGAQICMGARSRERLTLLAREMSAVSQALDIAKAGDTDIFLNFSLSRMKKLDGVICCIGSPWAPPLQRFNGAEWDRHVAESAGRGQRGGHNRLDADAATGLDYGSDTGYRRRANAGQ